MNPSVLSVGASYSIKIPGLSGKVKPKVLTTFTRQLATLVDAGLPLLRGMRVLEKQEKHPTLKSIINQLAIARRLPEFGLLQAVAHQLGAQANA